MKIPVVFTVLGLGIALYGCGIYSRYERPAELGNSALYRDIPAADTASLASLNWRELFTDTLLQKWIAQGLEQNFDLRTAQLKVEEAQAQLTAARLSFLPSVGATADARISGYTGQAMAKSIGLGANAQWEIDLFGSLLNANRAQRAALEGSTAYRQAVQTQLVASIASSYYSLLMLDAQLAITRKTLENWGQA